jgi:threonine dehydrogenase-like Zn-dependent dehydrogenase
MKSLMYLGPKRLEWCEKKDPGVEGPLEAIVAPLAAAACDLDTLIAAGKSPFPAPQALGHECVARVTQIGDAVKKISVGDTVVVPFQISCGDCTPCRLGHTGNCRSVPAFSTYGFGLKGTPFGGVFADFVRVPFADAMLVTLPTTLNPVAVASLSDNITDGWRAVSAVSQNPQAKVLIIGGDGCRSIGLYAAACAVALGAQRVDYVDTDSDRLRRAAAAGANAVEGRPESKRGVYTLTVDASGTEEGLRCALSSLEFEGTCYSVGILWDNKTPLPLLDMYVTGVTLRTGRSHARPSIPSILELIERGRLRPELVTSHTVSWEDLPQALAEGGYTKLIALPDIKPHVG